MSTPAGKRMAGGLAIGAKGAFTSTFWVGGDPRDTGLSEGGGGVIRRFGGGVKRSGLCRPAIPATSNCAVSALDDDSCFLKYKYV